MLLQAQLEAGQKQATSDAIFQAPLEDFDVLIRLRPEALPYPDRALAASPDSLPSSHEEEDDEQTNHKQARARLHSIPKGGLVTAATQYWSSHLQIVSVSLPVVSRDSIDN